MNLALKTIRLADYRPPDYQVAHVDLVFDLDPERTEVRAHLTVRRTEGTAGRPFVLDGDELDLVSVALDGRLLGPGDYGLDAATLTIPAPPDEFVLETLTRIHPAANTRLEGLYVSNGTFCTQCEAEGFRRITFFPDRPDVMATYGVTIRAGRDACPVLLSNGNPVAQRTLEGGRHEAVWHDPHPKPSYLFALVAGRLDALRDHFTTRSGRAVELAIYVEPGNAARAAHAMDSLKRSMAWDETRYGLEYDLDLFNIVAVSDFNMGAMENKGLNVFNSKYVLADPDTATDADYTSIEAIIAHEYFHNWTGNRITCRDWFQLSLKEGLTVFRDQQFSADMRSPAVRRIQSVRALRARQFGEDAGPLAHPVRPEAYIEINNFYTATVYEKGAEVIGMLHRLLGEAGFRRGIDLYFRRHDGQAVTCDDFVAALADANGQDLEHFKRWYSQAGTPIVEAVGRHDPAAKTYTLSLSQHTPPTPGQPDKAPLLIPLAIGLLGADGRDLPLVLDGRPVAGGVLRLAAARQDFRFEGVGAPPVLSLNRDFSAPIKLQGPDSEAARIFRMAHDSDPFNRWEAGQQAATHLLLDWIAGDRRDAGPFVDALAAGLGDPDRAFAALNLALPSEDYLADQMVVTDVDGIHAAREALRQTIAGRLAGRLLATYHACRDNRPFSLDAEAAGRRALKNAALAYLVLLETPETRRLVREQYQGADNMSDRMAALAVLADTDSPDRAAALGDFHDRFARDPLVIDKWLAVQAMSARADTLAQVVALTRDPAFSMRNPNKVRALVGAFANGNPFRFHAVDGGGYRFLADRVIELDPLNPQIAARLLQPLGRWRRFDPARQARMRAELERVLATPTLSRDSYEIASKSLG
ncbi:MAG: aminopeptidase N [Alphaproteobacteria bacterium]|nr:aminopeptidase N [Alphaproteobacteria bacterium]